MDLSKWLSETPIIREIYKRWVPTLGFLGAGLAAIGGAYQNLGLAFGGAIMAAFSTMASAVRQADFRDKLVDANEKIAEQAVEIKNIVTGGDSFAYIFFPKNYTSIIIVIPEGDYPLYDLSIEIIDEDLISPSDYRSGRLNFFVGTIAPSRVSRGRVLHWQGLDGQSKNFNITFSARNGYWTQLIKCRLIDGEWSYALKVEKQVDHEKIILLHERIDQNFPKNVLGNIDW